MGEPRNFICSNSSPVLVSCVSLKLLTAGFLTSPASWYLPLLVISKFRHIDILFNNAGVAIRKNTFDLGEMEWGQAIDVGLKGMYLVSHYVLPHMIKAGGGIA